MCKVTPTYAHEWIVGSVNAKSLKTPSKSTREKENNGETESGSVQRKEKAWKNCSEVSKQLSDRRIDWSIS